MNSLLFQSTCQIEVSYKSARAAFQKWLYNLFKDIVSRQQQPLHFKHLDYILRLSWAARVLEYEGTSFLNHSHPWILI